MQLQSGNVAIDINALRKQLKLKPDEKAEAHHTEEFFKGKRWHVLANAGGSHIWWEHKRFISSDTTYVGAMRCFNGWSRENPVLIYFNDDATATVVETSDYKERPQAQKNKLALVEKGVIAMPEKEKNKLICEVDPSRILELGDDHGPDNIWYGVPNGKVYWNRVYEGRAYTAVAPQGDTDRMAALGDRLMFRHGSAGGEPELFTAPVSVVTAGWVVGLFKKEPVKPPFDGICMSCKIHPVDEHGWCAKCGGYTCVKCGVEMHRRDLQRRSAGFQCPECNTQKFD